MCDEHAYINLLCTNCMTDYYVPKWCGDRLCPVCQQSRSNRYSKYFKNKINEVISKRKVIRFMTLTVRNTPKLWAGYADLTRAWKRLRQTELFKNKIEGGALSIEVTNNGNGWHVHLHIIYEGGYIHGSKLSALWKRVTPSSSYIVRTRFVRDVNAARRYLSKYPFKPAESETWDRGQRDEYQEFMRGKRLFRTFGRWYGDKLLPKDKACSNCGATNCWFLVPPKEGEYHYFERSPYLEHKLSEFG